VKNRKKVKKTREDEVYLTHPAFKEDRKRDLLRRLAAPFWRQSVYAQLAMFLVMLAIWPLPIVNPVKLLVVLFHELSHILMAYLTGGVVFGMAIDPGGAGVTLGMGGNEVLIVAAGYIGSLAFGILLYYLCAVWEPREVWAVLFLICCLSIVFRWLNIFTALFGVGAILIMGVGFFILADFVKKFLLRCVATTCCLYPIIDVGGEALEKTPTGFLLNGAVIGSDVSRLARLTDIGAVYIGAFWIVIGLVVCINLVSWSAERDARQKVKLALFRKKHKPREYWKYNPDDPSTIPHYTIR
jgi:hypothetical protein